MTEVHAPKLSTAWWGLVIRAMVAFAILVIANLVRLPIPMPADDYHHRLVFGFTAFITCRIVVLLTWLWMRWVENRSLAIYQLINFRALATKLPAGIALGGIPVVAMWLFVPNLELQAANTLPTWLVIWYIIGGALILQEFPEELIYRGWLFTVTEQRPWLSLVWTSVAFGLIHLVSQVGQQGSLEFLLYLICCI